MKQKKTHTNKQPTHRNILRPIAARLDLIAAMNQGLLHDINLEKKKRHRYQVFDEIRLNLQSRVVS